MSTIDTDKYFTFIKTPEEITSLVDLVAPLDTSLGDDYPPLYVDMEGERLSRDGTISLMTLFVANGLGLKSMYIIDIHTLGGLAFSTVGSCGKSLKDIFESPELLKVFFDVRNDSDALYAHYGIKLQGVRDVQLMESATRRTTHTRRFLSGLANCVAETIHGQDRAVWRLCKENGERLWNPQKGGSYNVFNTRPPSIEIFAYCVGDVKYLSHLYQKFRRGTKRWGDLIAEESQSRVSASQEVGYLPHGTGRTLSPWSPDQNKMLDSWSEVNPQEDYFGCFSDNYMDGWRDEDQYWHDSDEVYDDCDFEDFTRVGNQGPPT